MKLEGKVAIVTGAARGIGHAIAMELARRGADVAMQDLVTLEQAEPAIQAVEQQGRRVLFFQGDVSDRASDERLFEKTVQDFGRLDILVNNAAHNIRKPLIELAVEDVEKVWAVTLWGVFHCSQLAARQMVKQGEGGNILTISSIHGSRAYPTNTAYDGAKAAVNHMSRTWAMELAAHRIRVNTIEPGWIDTPGERAFMSEEQIRERALALPFKRLGQPAEIANAVAFLVSDDASYVSGSCVRVDGALSLVR